MVECDGFLVCFGQSFCLYSETWLTRGLSFSFASSFSSAVHAVLLSSLASDRYDESYTVIPYLRMHAACMPFCWDLA